MKLCFILIFIIDKRKRELRVSETLHLNPNPRFCLFQNPVARPLRGIPLHSSSPSPLLCPLPSLPPSLPRSPWFHNFFKYFYSI